MRGDATRDAKLHPSDQELLLSADGELSRRRAAEVRVHLAACWPCRARMAEIERTIVDFVRVRNQDLDSMLPPVAGPRAILKAQLAESVKKAPRETWWQQESTLNVQLSVSACAVALLVVLFAGIQYHKSLEFHPSLRNVSGLLPDRNFTPGASRPVTMGAICSMQHDDVIHPVPNTLRQRVFDEYGLRDASAENYEVDYLITPGLGGADDIRNLWPEPRYNTTWNSFVKDQLEDYLHQSVCSGKLSLATAQQDVASDWISAYKKYFHTDQPLARSAQSDISRTIVIAKRTT